MSQNMTSKLDITPKLFEYARKNKHQFGIFPDQDTGMVMAIIFKNPEVTKDEMGSTIDAIKRNQDPDPAVVVQFTYAKESQALQDLVNWVRNETITQDPRYVNLTQYAEKNGYKIVKSYDEKKGKFTCAIQKSGKEFFGDLDDLSRWLLMSDEEKIKALNEISMEPKRRRRARRGQPPETETGEGSTRNKRGSSLTQEVEGEGSTFKKPKTSAGKRVSKKGKERDD